MTAQLPLHLVSVGYEGREVATLIEQLQRQRVGYLVDVRLNAVSRKPGLSKRKLAEALTTAGITYVHQPALGNPRENREGLRAGTQHARGRFREVLLTDGANEALDQVSELLDHDTVALLCFERNHSTCHRNLVAEAITEKRPSLEVVQI